MSNPAAGLSFARWFSGAGFALTWFLRKHPVCWSTGGLGLQQSCESWGGGADWKVSVEQLMVLLPST